MENYQDKIDKTKELLAQYVYELAIKAEDLKESEQNVFLLNVMEMFEEHYRAIYEINIDHPEIIKSFIPVIQKLHLDFIEKLKQGF